MFTRIVIVALFLLAGCASTEPVQEYDTQENFSAATMEDLLENEIRRQHPGVQIYRGINGIQLRIRGALYEPLYVVDGVPLASIPGRTLFGITPDEIEKIEVITELARLSYYGMRGGNGVVKITTKR